MASAAAPSTPAVRSNPPAAKRLQVRKLADCFLAFCGIAIFLLMGQTPGLEIPACIAILVQTAYAVLAVRHNRMLLLIYAVFFYACYSICYANYLHPIRTTMFTSLADTTSAYTAVGILLLFTSFVVMLLPQHIEHSTSHKGMFMGEHDNALFVWVLALILVVIAIYGFGRPEAIGGSRGTPSALYEYSVILFIVGFYLAGSNTGLRVLLFAILLVFAAQNIVYGGRVTAVQLLLVAFYMLFSDRMTTGQVVAVGAVFFVFFISFGVVRTSIWNDGLDSLVSAFGSTLNRGLAWDTAYSSWHTSITFVEYDGIISQGQHAYLLKQWLTSIVLGGSLVPDSSLAAMTRAYFAHYNGGVLPVYCWFHLGYGGVVLIGAYASLLTSVIAHLSAVKAKSLIVAASLRLSMLYVTVTVPRWFLYSPSQITRGLLLCFLVTLVALWLDRSFATMRNSRVGKAPHYQQS